ncbi:MAG: 2-oxoacid:acceptor oxidoreductase subunit alpha [Armatimonadota bacterium]|nr:2-oxoacid:acceptor oxidoreductase subunit alpha [Armatimonadota bacterium]
MGRVRLVRGNVACARAAIAAGCRFYAGYPITPSSEIAEEMAALLPKVGGVFVQMEDEIASLAACIGASIGGLLAMTATSGPGFSLMQEHLGFAALAEIPCVVVDVMRLGPSTGLPTAPSQGDVYQARWGTHGDRPSIVLAPASVREVYDLTIRAFQLSERFRTPVILLYDEVVGHMMEPMELPSLEGMGPVRRANPVDLPKDYLPYAADEDGVPPLVSFGSGVRYHITGLIHDESGFPTQDPAKVSSLLRRLHEKISRNLHEIVSVEPFLLEDAEVAVFAYGIVARAAREAVQEARARGMRVGLLRSSVLWPFPEDAVREVARTVRAIVVAEMNLGQMVYEVERAAGGRAEVVGCFQVDGRPISPETILDAVSTLCAHPSPSGKSKGGRLKEGN